MTEQPDLENSNLRCIGESDRTWYIHDPNPNLAKAYVRKGAKPVVNLHGFFNRILRFIGLSVFAKKTCIEWVGGEYIRDPNADIKLKESS